MITKKPIPPHSHHPHQTIPTTTIYFDKRSGGDLELSSESLTKSLLATGSKIANSATASNKSAANRAYKHFDSKSSINYIGAKLNSTNDKATTNGLTASSNTTNGKQYISAKMSNLKYNANKSATNILGIYTQLKIFPSLSNIDSVFEAQTRPYRSII